MADSDGGSGSESVSKIVRRFDKPERPLVPKLQGSHAVSAHRTLDWVTKGNQSASHHAMDNSVGKRSTSQSLDWLTKGNTVSMHSADGTLASVQADDHDLRPVENRSRTKEDAESSPSKFDLKAKVRELEEQIKANVGTPELRAKGLAASDFSDVTASKVVGMPAGRTVSLTAAAQLSRATDLEHRGGEGERPLRTISATVGSRARNKFPDSPSFFTLEAPVEDPEHRSKSPLSEPQAESVDVPTLLQLLAQKERVIAEKDLLLAEKDKLLAKKDLELNAMRVWQKQRESREAARVKRATEDIASPNAVSGNSKEQAAASRPTSVVVQPWDQSENESLRTSLHKLMGAYKSSWEKIRHLEDALYQRDAEFAAATMVSRTSLALAEKL